MRKLTSNEMRIIAGGKKEVEKGSDSALDYFKEVAGDVKETFVDLFTGITNWLGGISTDVQNEVDKGIARSAKRGKKLDRKQEHTEL